jgi:hypothetical protein
VRKVSSPAEILESVGTANKITANPVYSARCSDKSKPMNNISRSIFMNYPIFPQLFQTRNTIIALLGDRLGTQYDLAGCRIDDDTGCRRQSAPAAVGARPGPQIEQIAVPRAL